MITPADLDRIPALDPLDAADKAWLAEQATELTAEAGEVVFRQGAPATTLYFLLEGTIVFRAQQDGQEKAQFVVEAGQISGMLPRSRMTHWAGTGRAAAPVRAACFDAGRFDALLDRVPALDGILAAALADRIREATRLEQQQGKLVALGKLSAGLAHELNNPAAAIKRTVALLRTRLDDLPARVQALASFGLRPDQLAFACSLGETVAEAPALRAVERAEREDAVADWLGAHGLGEQEACAETFVEAGLTVDALERIADALDPAALPAVLAWVETSLAADLMLREVTRASERISTIVQAVKGYSHMDEAPVRAPADVRDGLESTLTMLAHELRARGITVVRDYDDALPPVPVRAGELNQVWTNLLDNAIDAMPGGGELKLATRHEDGAAVIEITDSGSGIPEDVQPRLFEPFFTTKGVGEGTGLGLDIARRIVTQGHGGQIFVRSEPGCTVFTVRLPLHDAGEAPASGDASPLHA